MTAVSTVPAVIQEPSTVGRTQAPSGKVKLILNQVFPYTPAVEETMAGELRICQRTPQSCSELGSQLS